MVVCKTPNGTTKALCVPPRFFGVGIVNTKGISRQRIPLPQLEEQREDVLLVVARIDQSTQDSGRAPEVAFEVGLCDMRQATRLHPTLSPL